MAMMIKRGRGNWCYASRQGKITWISKVYGTVIKYRMMGYHLADIVKEGIFKRIRRTHRNPDGTIILLTAAYCLTFKGCKYLIKHGMEWGKNQYNKLKLKYVPSKPGKPYDEAKHLDREEVLKPPGENPFLDPGHRRRLGLPDAPPFDPKKA